VEDVHSGLGEIPGLHLRRLFKQDDQVAFGPKEVERDVVQVLRRQPAVFVVQEAVRAVVGRGAGPRALPGGQIQLLSTRVDRLLARSEIVYGRARVGPAKDARS